MLCGSQSMLKDVSQLLNSRVFKSPLDRVRQEIMFSSVLSSNDWPFDRRD